MIMTLPISMNPFLIISLFPVKMRGIPWYTPFSKFSNRPMGHGSSPFPQWDDLPVVSCVFSPGKMSIPNLMVNELLPSGKLT
jgi:hypothetical protein